MATEINSPLSGVITQIVVKEGDTVNQGDTVAILESMKMEIPIESTAAGTVTEVKAMAGGFAKQGDVLVLIG